eukprot:3298455-Pleurochrysis_carterae.AAC.5
MEVLTSVPFGARLLSRDKHHCLSATVLPYPYLRSSIHAITALRHPLTRQLSKADTVAMVSEHAFMLMPKHRSASYGPCMPPLLALPVLPPALQPTLSSPRLAPRPLFAPVLLSLLSTTLLQASFSHLILFHILIDTPSLHL